MRTAALLLLLIGALAGPARAGPPSESPTFPGVGPVALYAPAGPPRQVVLFVSGDGGWNLGVVPMAEQLRDLGALVAGIDVRRFLKSLESGGPCAYPAGALEELSRAVQLHRRLPRYERPVLVGYSSGATLVYAALAAAPPETFRGAISLGFCPDLAIHRPLCEERGLRATRRLRRVGYDLAPDAGLARPWMVLQGEADQVCAPAATRAFVAGIPGARLFALPKVGHGFSVPSRWQAQFQEAYEALAAARPGDEPPFVGLPAATGQPDLQDLSLVEVPSSAPGESGSGDLMAVIVTGDGGWAEIDKGLAAGLAEAGLPVVGWSSLRYYWTPRTPERAAADLARLLEHYLAAWRKQRVLLAGYSFGADVLPFLVNRLPPDLQRRVAGVALLGLSESAAFEFHVSSWLGAGGDVRYPTLPEIERLDVPAVCVRGSEERDSACLAPRGARLRQLVLPGGHHFGGEYGRLARLILEALLPAPSP